MLVLTRKAKEEIRIGNDITVTIVRVKGQSVRIGINAPSHVHIMRSELGDKNGNDEINPVSTKPESKLEPTRSKTVPKKAEARNLASNSPVMQRLENQLKANPPIEKDRSVSKGRFQSPLGSTDSFSRVFGHERQNRAHHATDERDIRENS